MGWNTLVTVHCIQGGFSSASMVWVVGRIKLFLHPCWSLKAKIYTPSTAPSPSPSFPSCSASAAPSWRGAVPGLVIWKQLPCCCHFSLPHLPACHFPSLQPDQPWCISVLGGSCICTTVLGKERRGQVAAGAQLPSLGAAFLQLEASPVPQPWWKGGWEKWLKHKDSSWLHSPDAASHCSAPLWAQAQAQLHGLDPVFQWAGFSLQAICCWPLDYSIFSNVTFVAGCNSGWTNEFNSTFLNISLLSLRTLTTRPSEALGQEHFSLSPASFAGWNWVLRIHSSNQFKFYIILFPKYFLLFFLLCF